jgi:hypothetical protein
MKDLIPDINPATTGPSDASDFTSVIILVGGSVIKRRLFEMHLQALDYKDVGIVHLTPPNLAKMREQSCASSWDPRDSLSDFYDHFKLIAIVPLIDAMAPFCDLMCQKLGIRGNDPSTSLLRVDKECMQQACSAAGVPFTISRRIESLHEAICVWRDEFFSADVVVKPVRSGGCDGVAVCNSIANLSDHVNRQLNALNLERTRNSELVMQEYLRVECEYVVNTVSINGFHFVCDVWRSSPKRSGELFLYDTQELVTNLTSISHVIDYAKSVLNAVQVREGACHTEIGQCRDELDQIRLSLIEVNPRLAGEIRTTNEIAGWHHFDQIYWLLVSILCPHRLVAAPLNSVTPNVIVVFLKNSLAGPCYLLETGIALIRELPSFFRFGRGLAWANDRSLIKKHRVGRTVDLVSSPGAVILVGASAREDALKIRSIEKNSLYMHNS